jgi:hypothetical protein
MAIPNADPVVVASANPLADATAIEWFADAPDAERHAFPDDRTFRRSICDLGIRWTVRFREHGLGYCEGCQIALHQRIRAASDALVAASVGDQAGDHYFRTDA